MQQVFGFLAALAGIYSLLIIIRLILSWFSGTAGTARTPDILYRITDPYLNWWRNSLKLRIGHLDLSPIAAMAFLSVVQSILHSFSTPDKITLGRIIVIVLFAAWSVIAFILGFFFIIILLRLIAYLTNRNIYSPFWQIINTISQPVLYRINRIIFGDRITGFIKGIIVSLFVLAAIRIGGAYLIRFLAGLINKIPL